MPWIIKCEDGSAMKQFKAKESLVKGGEDERLGKELKELILRRPQPKWYL